MTKITFEEARVAVKSRLTDFLLANNIKSNHGKTMFKCINPAHNDHDPSMHVFDSWNGEKMYYCMGCGTTGDIFQANHILHNKPMIGFDFIMDNMKPLADAYGIDFDVRQLTEEEIEEMNIKSVYRIVADLIIYNFRYNFDHINQKVKDYLNESRLVGTKEEILSDAITYGMGYVSNWDDLKNELLSRGIDEDFMRHVDITEAIFNPNNLIFCIRDEHNVVRGFASRNCLYNKADGIGRKYLNTSNNVVYSKRSLLYNLNGAIRKRTGRYSSLYIVEGYSDAIALDRAGLKAAAIGSTKFNEDHISLLQRVGETDIVLLLDGDTEGIKATARVITDVMEGIRNFRTRIVTLPDELDPNEFLRQFTVEDLMALSHVSAFEWRLHHLMVQTDLDPYELAKQVVPLIVNEVSEIERDRMSKQLSDVTKIPLDVIRGEVRKISDDDKIKVQTEREILIDSMVKNIRKNPSDALLILQDAEQNIRSITEKHNANIYDFPEFILTVQNNKIIQGSDDSSDVIHIGRMPRFTEKMYGPSAGKMYLIGGHPNSGKCIAEDALILTTSGKRVPMKRVVNEKLDVMTYDETDGRIKSTKVDQYYDNGKKKVFLTTVTSGRQVSTTDNHPFLTLNGWKELKDLKIDDYIAVPRKYEFNNSNSSITTDELRLLAYLIAEGGMTHTSVNFTNTDSIIVQDMQRIANSFGDKMKPVPSDPITYTIGAGLGKKCNVRAIYNKYCEVGKLSKYKTLPTILFESSNEQISEFLKILYSCDGSIYQSNKRWRIEYTSASKQLVKELQHLLLRFGIVGNIGYKRIKNKFDAWRIVLENKDDVISFIEQINFFGKKTILAQKAVESCYKNKSIRNSNKYTFDPIIARSFILQYVKQTGKKDRAWWRQNNIEYVKRAIRRKSKIGRNIMLNIAKIIESKELEIIANSDIIFEKIVSINYTGVKHTYDLTINKTHNFIADDILVHNTSWLLNYIIGVLESDFDYEHWDQPANKDRSNNVCIFYHTVDDTVEEILPRLAALIAAPLHPEVTINKMHYPDKYDIVDREGFMKIRNWAYDKIAQWGREGKLIIKDASIGATLTTAQNVIRNIKQKYPDKFIIHICDNLYNLADFANFEDDGKRIKEICRVAKQDILVKEKIMGFYTIEYKKGGDNVKSRQLLNELIRDSKQLEYLANWIGHLINESYNDPETDMFFWDPSVPPDSRTDDNKLPIVYLVTSKNKITDFKGSIYYYFFHMKATFLEMNSKDVARLTGSVQEKLKKVYFIDGLDPNECSSALETIPRRRTLHEIPSVA